MMYRQRFIDPIYERGKALPGISSNRSSHTERTWDLSATSDKSPLLLVRRIAGSLLILLGTYGGALAQATNNNPPEANTAAQTKPASCDVACIRENSDRAARFCAPRIEAQAPIDFEWISRPFGNIFQEAEPSPESTAVIRYR